jgi:flagellar basal-body rod modification protein FlgD
MSIGSFSAESGRQDFLNLFVSQLQYQNPLEPIGQQEFLQQLAQMSTVEGLEDLNTKFDDMLKLQSLSSGSEMLGLTARFGPGPDDTGVVNEVGEVSGQVLARIGDRMIPMNQIISVAPAPTTDVNEMSAQEFLANLAQQTE